MQQFSCNKIYNSDRLLRIHRPVAPCLQALPPFLATLLDRLEACRVFSAAERPNHCLINSYERAAPCPMHQDGPLCESPFLLPTTHTLPRSMAVVPSHASHTVLPSSDFDVQGVPQSCEITPAYASRRPGRGRHSSLFDRCCNRADLDKVVTVTLGGPALIGFRRSLPNGSAAPDTVAEVRWPDWGMLNQQKRPLIVPSPTALFSAN